MTQTEHVESYFVRLEDGRYMPTSYAGGAWRDDELHLAPVAGLLVHKMEQWRLERPESGLVFSRFSFEVLGQIAREPIEVSIEVVRPGRTIELIEATATVGDRVTLRARAWLLLTDDTHDIAGHEFDLMPAPERSTGEPPLAKWNGQFCANVDGGHSALRRPGRAQAWLTNKIVLVSNEPISPLAHFCRLLDAANGIAVRQDPREWMYPNVDLTLHFFRQPTGEWVGLDTRVAFGAGGIGLTSSVMHDIDGPVGTVQQSLTLRKL